MKNVRTAMTFCKIVNMVFFCIEGRNMPAMSGTILNIFAAVSYIFSNVMHYS